VAYVDVQNMYGAPTAMKIMDQFYNTLVRDYGLSPKTVLEGFSRGGLFSFNWAALHPERVAAMYVDAPVCDVASWPGGKGKGKGSPEDWRRLLDAYGVTEQEALSGKLSPVNRLAPLAEARIPVLAVVGDADDVVPVEENMAVVERKYRAMGGSIRVIHKPGMGHHPHSLPDPAPIVDFILESVRKTGTPAAGRETQVSG
jgi:pimeloyl-ACP methyl ester carboxylesterase